jgi:hypothetical protein
VSSCCSRRLFCLFVMYNRTTAPHSRSTRRREKLTPIPSILIWEHRRNIREKSDTNYSDSLFANVPANVFARAPYSCCRESLCRGTG